MRLRGSAPVPRRVRAVLGACWAFRAAAAAPEHLLSGARVLCVWLCCATRVHRARPVLRWVCVLLELCPLVCPACGCVSVVRLCPEALVRSRRGKSAGEKGSTRALSKGFVVCECAQPAEGLRAPLPRSSGGDSRSSQIFCWLCWTPFLFPVFPPFSPFFSLLLLSPAQGQGRLVVVAPAAPGAQSHGPPGGLTAMQPRFGHFQQPRPFYTGRTFEKGNVFALAALRAAA